jgi:hypothetical protein
MSSPIPSNFKKGWSDVNADLSCRNPNPRRRIRLTTICRGCIRILSGRGRGSEMAYRFRGRLYIGESGQMELRAAVYNTAALQRVGAMGHLWRWVGEMY